MPRRWILGLTGAVGVAALVWVFRQRPQQAPKSLPAAAPQAATYVDPKLCAACHAKIAKTYAETGMGRSFHRATPERMNKEDFRGRNTFHHRASDRHYTMIERGGRYFQRRHQIGPGGGEINIFEREIHHVVGSGNHARSYFHRTGDGRLFELPVAWYSENGGYWAMNPGYDRPDHDDFRRRVSSTCLFCHNAYPRLDLALHESPSAEPVFPSPLPEGIDCQRCHGPGSRHVEAAAQNRRGSIVNPGRLGAQREFEVCLQCHLETTSFPLPNSLGPVDRGVFAYRPGEPLETHALHFDHASGQDNKFEIAHHGYRLRKSACFLKSGVERLRCTTCHNPHHIPQRGPAAAAGFAKVCQSCHAAEAMASAIAAGRHPRDVGACVSCHMPKRRTDDVVHVAMTDHLIQRRPPAEQERLAPRAEKTAQQQAYRGEVKLYYPEEPPAGASRDLYTALAQVRDQSNLAAGVAQLEQAIARHNPPQADFDFYLGEAHATAGDTGKAIAAYRRALEREGGYWPAWHRLGATLAQTGRAEEGETALRKGLALRPRHALMLTDLGLALAAQAKLPEAMAAWREARDADEFAVEARNNLGSALAEHGGGNAEEPLREALNAQPEHAETHANLARLALNRRDLALARYHFEKALASNPRLATAHFNYGIFFAVQGQLARAKAEFAAAAEFGDEPLKQAAAEALARLVSDSKR